jgi:hypothetical protein
MRKLSLLASAALMAISASAYAGSAVTPESYGATPNKVDQSASSDQTAAAPAASSNAAANESSSTSTQSAPRKRSNMMPASSPSTPKPECTPNMAGQPTATQQSSAADPVTNSGANAMASNTGLTKGATGDPNCWNQGPVGNPGTTN